MEKNIEKIEKKEKALVISQIELTKEQRSLIQTATPVEFIKTRVARGGKTAKYVEGGYVIARLNQIFGAPNWDFDIVDKEILDKEVWVRGRLTIKDHKNGYTIGKSQFGTHERASGVPLGDTLKAAGTDALKKCASLLGIALDVYWKQLDQDRSTDVKEKTLKIISAPTKSLVAISKEKIERENDTQILAEWRDKIYQSKQFTNDEKVELMTKINRKINAKQEQGTLTG